tara:strand:- start:1635 stop:1919 length:285 start_codon:yes stop_codon:yes gene_type:complete
MPNTKRTLGSWETYGKDMILADSYGAVVGKFNSKADGELMAAAPKMEEALAGLVEAIEKLSTPELKAIPEPLRTALAHGYVHGRIALTSARGES